MLPAMKDIESRIGVPHLEGHLSQWALLSKQAAPLRAMHGSFGTWDAMRKSNLSVIRMAIRAKAVEQNRKVTEAQLDEEAHAHDDYITFITKATLDRTKLAELEAELQALEFTLRREQSLIAFVTKEATL